MNKEEFTGEEMLEEMTKLNPERLNDDTRKLFYTIMKVIDERDNLQKGNISLQEDIENYRASVQALKVELGKKDKTIKEVINVLNYMNNGEICDNVTILANKLLQILERADK